jgi:hypothetical protein
MLVKSVTTRFTIPGEIVLGVMALARGIGGQFSTGHIHEILLANNDIFTWTFLLLTTGSAMFIASVSEFLYGRSWDDAALLRSASIRSMALFFHAGAWLYILKLLFEVDAVQSVLTLAITAPLLSAISVWFYYEIKRAQYALDKKYHTPGLLLRR